MAAPKAVLFGLPNCSYEIEQSILHYLVTDITHPQASTRFGTHFLAFPLPHVNRHLRQRVAKLLYSIVYKTKREPLLRPVSQALSGETLLLVPSRNREHDDIREEDDPRHVFHDADDEDIGEHRGLHFEEYKASSLDHTSPSLLVSFVHNKNGQQGASPPRWHIHTEISGYEASEYRHFLQTVSTAWFEKTQRPPNVTRWGEFLYKQERDAHRKAFQDRTFNRYGLKSAVPVPLNEKRISFDIALPPQIHPTWGTRGDPGPHKEQDISLDENFPSWKFTYTSEYVYPRRGRPKQTLGTQILSELDVHLIQVPLLEVLRPPIAGESPYHEDGAYGYY